ncbi:hypothetical protein INR49_024430 [Caranx melampygus]|nr:hypothetical protein INR49_024430 [Caranx melampygus]
MDPYQGNGASAAGPKKDKKSKKNCEDGDGKKKFIGGATVGSAEGCVWFALLCLFSLDVKAQR